MVFCPNCGTDVKNEEYCQVCGEDILIKRLEKRSAKTKPILIICPNCSAQTSIQDVYCEICGYQMKTQQQQPLVRPVMQYQAPMQPQYTQPIPYRNPNKLYRSRRRRTIAGVCGGIGEKYAISPGIIRLIFIFATFFYGLGLWVYIILAIFVPAEPREY